MKILSLFVLIAALAVCQGAKIAEPLAAQNRSVGSIITDVFELLKIKMVDGFPKYGVPPLAPFELAHKKFNFQTGDFSAVGQVDDLVLHGLNEFEIRVMDANLILSRVRFELNFASLNVTTDYNADIGTGYHVKREGGAFIALEDLNISGQVRYSAGLVPSNSNLRIKEIKANIVVGNVVSKIENLSQYRILNRKLNEVVEEFITLTINDNTELAAHWIDGTLTPICNDLIGDRSIKDLLDLLNKGK